MEVQKHKYSRTFHLPWTAHKTTDDKIWDEGELVKAFWGKEILITEKMDGENTTVYHDGSFHARSIDGRSHPSRNRMVGIAKGLGAQLPLGYRLCGEYLFAEHSISYTNLPCYYMVFGIYDDTNFCLSWDETEYVAKEIGATLVPVLFRMPWEQYYKDHQLWTRSIMGTFHHFNECEGYVIRTTEGFPYEELGSHCGKYVRKDHVQTDEHWMHKPVTPNGLVNEYPSTLQPL